MYVKIHSSKKDNNRGSCNDLINYLEKENQEKDILARRNFLIKKQALFLFVQHKAQSIITKETGERRNQVLHDHGKSKQG